MSSIPCWDNPCLREGGERLDFGHLGGTSTVGDTDSWFPELWTWLVGDFSALSVLDVGCGVGYAQRFFIDAGLEAIGLDCEQMRPYHLLPEHLRSHDLTTGPWVGESLFDLVWCCDVAEHIEEQFVQNVIDTLVKNCGKVLAFCAAPCGSGGYHHVNVNDGPYWINKLEAAGLKWRQDLTEKGRSLCPASYGRSPYNYFRRSGLVFTHNLPR